MTDRYEIHIQGLLDRRWQDWFGEMLAARVDPNTGETVLSGSLPDQSALHGVLERIRDLNLKLISVCLVPGEDSGSPAVNPHTQL